MTENCGHTRAIYIPNGLDEKIETARKRLGWSRSYFYKYALSRLLQEFSILSETVHETVPESNIAHAQKEVKP